ncbi:hypothetical protein AB0F91_36120 [Amycolatopsis sp. NPDC023774]
MPAGWVSSGTHAGPHLPMSVGLRVGLDAPQRTLSLLEPVVRA